jgi:hypothetical protein
MLLVVAVALDLALVGAAAADGDRFNLYLMNHADNAYPVGFRINETEYCYNGDPRIGQWVGRKNIAPGSQVTISVYRDQGSSCDGDQGEFIVELFEGGATEPELVYFEFSNGGELLLRDKPNAYVGSLTRNADGSYTWETTPKIVTASRPVGSWVSLCENFCDRTLRTELVEGSERSTSVSSEKKTAFTKSLEAGVEFDIGFSAKGSISHSQEETLGRSMSEMYSSSQAKSDETRVSMTIEQMEANDVFAVWQWEVRSELSSGSSVVLVTTKFACTPDGNPPQFLPGSTEAIASCRRKPPASVPVVAEPTPEPASERAPEFDEPERKRQQWDEQQAAQQESQAGTMATGQGEIRFSGETVAASLEAMGNGQANLIRIQANDGTVIDITLAGDLSGSQVQGTMQPCSDGGLCTCTLNSDDSTGQLWGACMNSAHEDFGPLELNFMIQRN